MEFTPTIISELQRSPIGVVFFLIAIVISLTVHEFAHAYAASRQGDQTARMQGRLTLNPLTHLDPVGSIFFLLAGIGWAKPVPVNPAAFKDGRLGDFYVSIAGIVTNLVVAVIFSIPFRIIQWTGSDLASVDSVWLQFCAIMIFVNCLLAAFNLIPIAPLDGSKALGILVPRSLWRLYQEYLRIGPVILVAIIGLAFILKINVITPVLGPLVSFFQYVTAGFPNGIL